MLSGHHLSTPKSIGSPVMILAIVLVWLGTMIFAAYRVSTLGGLASTSISKGLDYIVMHGGAHPETIRLNQPYGDWALALNMTDPAGYIRAGLGFADGQGISTKQISAENPGAKTYSPYYVQAPGVPFVIGCWIKLFGAASVFPYFILIALMHLLTASCAMLLARPFLKSKTCIFGAGLLSLLCPSALDFNFAVGLFSGEPFSALFLALAFLALGAFWRGPSTFNRTIVFGLLFGSFLVAASYFRDIYSAFAQFCFAIVPLSQLRNKERFKRVLVFITAAAIVFSALQLPWRLRNQHLFGEFAMSSSTHYGYGMLRGIWQDYKDCGEWCWNSALGLGNYLAPEQSQGVIERLDHDKKAGSTYSIRKLAEAIWRHPAKAFCFKFSVYDTLWFGQRCHPFIYLWCLTSTIFFLVFLYETRFQFIPELWLFPLFLFGLSIIIHYELRYSQPFYLLVTPITTMFVLQKMIERKKPVSSAPSNDESEREPVLSHMSVKL